MIFIFLGWILIDRCGKHFATVLNYLRDSSAPLPQSETELKELLAEAKYYLIEELVAQCEALLAKKKEQHDPICRVPLITSTKEERLLVSTANKVRNCTKVILVFFKQTINTSNHFQISDIRF